MQDRLLSSFCCLTVLQALPRSETAAGTKDTLSDRHENPQVCVTVVSSGN